LDEKTLPAATESTATSVADIEKDSDAVTEPTEVTLGDIELRPADDFTLVKSSELSGSSPGQSFADGGLGISEAAQPWTVTWAKAHMQALVSTKQISLRKVDVTTIILEAATAGALVTGLAVMLLKSR
jgi:hypothetical protein